jgi:hypothetical protein
MSKEVYKLIESNVNTTKAPRLVGISMRRLDGFELTNLIPDAPVLGLAGIHSLRHLSPAETDPKQKSREVRVGGGSVVKKEELLGKYKLHTYG